MPGAIDQTRFFFHQQTCLPTGHQPRQAVQRVLANLLPALIHEQGVAGHRAVPGKALPAQFALLVDHEFEPGTERQVAQLRVTLLFGRGARRGRRLARSAVALVAEPGTCLEFGGKLGARGHLVLATGRGQAARDRRRFIVVIPHLQQRGFHIGAECGVGGLPLAAAGDFGNARGQRLALVPFGRLLAPAQQGQRKHVRPGLAQQRLYEARWRALFADLLDARFGLLLGRFQTLLATRGVHMPSLGHFGLARKCAQMRLDVAVGCDENRLVALIVVDDLLDRAAQLVQQLRVDIVLAQPDGAGFGHGVEQFAHRVLVAHEKMRIGQGRAGHRHLQLG